MAHVPGQYLHVASQHDQIDMLATHQIEYLMLLLHTIVGAYRKMMKGDAVRGGKPGVIVVIRNDARDFGAQLAAL